MITVTLEGSTWGEIVYQASSMFNSGPEVVIEQAPKSKGGRPAKPKGDSITDDTAAIQAQTVGQSPAVVETIQQNLFAPAPPPDPAPVATLEEASAALKAIVNTAGMGMPKASAIMEKVTGKKLFREVTPDQYGALVAACKEAMK